MIDGSTDTKRTVRTQAELDNAIRDGVSVVVIDSPCGVWLTLGDSGSATVRACGSSNVEASDSSTVDAYDSATVCAYDSSTVRAYDSAIVRACDSATVCASGSATVDAYDSATVRASGSATVYACESSTVYAYESSTVDAYDSATVCAYDSATVRAYDSVTVDAYGSATVRASDSVTVYAYGSSNIRAYDSATVDAGRYVAVHLYSQRVAITGGVVIDMTDIDLADAATWCDLAGIAVENGSALVYKYVDADFNAGHNHTLTAYRPGETVTATDWNPVAERGGGLHFGPSPKVARNLAWRGLGPTARWVLCEIDLAEAVGVGDKIKARSCRVLYEVDALGKAVSS